MCRLYLPVICIFFCIVCCICTEIKICEDDNPCRCRLNNGSFIDLSTIGLKLIPRFYAVPESQPNEITDRALYFYNPCYIYEFFMPYAQTKEKEEPCVDAAACKLVPGDEAGNPPQIYSIGIQRTAVFYSDGEETFVNYTVPGAPSNLTVHLICNESVNYHLTIDGRDKDSHYQMTLTSKCCCIDAEGCATDDPDSPDKGGLSTGSILLILFFTGVALYLVTGIVYNFCNGATGLELIPNITFWNDLPALIIDGFVFSCSCVGQRNAERTYSDI